MLIILLWKKEIESSHKTPKFKAGERLRITKYKKMFSKAYIKNCPKEIFVIDSVSRTNPWIYKFYMEKQ